MLGRDFPTLSDVLAQSSFELAAEELGSEPIITATGEISFRPSSASFFPTRIAFARLNDLAQRAVGGKPTLKTDEPITASEAVILFRVANLAFIYSALESGLEGQEQRFIALSESASSIGNMIGLESAFASLVLMLGDYENEQINSARDLIAKVGLPDIPSGRLPSAIVVDGLRHHSMIGIDGLRDLKSAQSNSWLEKIRLRRASMGMDREGCMGASRLAGSVIGATVGATIGATAGGAVAGPPGAVAGAGSGFVGGHTVGRDIGEDVGSMYCKPDKPADSANGARGNNGNQGAKDNEDPPPPPDPEPPQEPEKDGCWPRDYDFFARDAYSRLVTRQLAVPLSFGKGLEIFALRTKEGDYRFDQAPLEASFRNLDRSLRNIGREKSTPIDRGIGRGDVGRGDFGPGIGRGNFSSGREYSQLLALPKRSSTITRPDPKEIEGDPHWSVSYDHGEAVYDKEGNVIGSTGGLTTITFNNGPFPGRTIILGPGVDVQAYLRALREVTKSWNWTNFGDPGKRRSLKEDAQQLDSLMRELDSDEIRGIGGMDVRMR
jgi:hypothetical protein